VKQSRGSYLSEQTLYFEFTHNHKPVYWSSIPHPRRVHVEYADEKGNLHRQESVLESVEFTIRVPARFRADNIRFFTINPSIQGKIKKGTPLSDQPPLRLIKEIPISLKPR
ncbi:hypothetical protein JYT44_01180, partial [Caldithrix abyssi]|nr:hypothetical protein [Caldithrix abyssi]